MSGAGSQQLSAWREVGEEMVRIIAHVDKADLLPDWFEPRLLQLLEASSPVPPTQEPTICPVCDAKPDVRKFCLDCGGKGIVVAARQEPTPEDRWQQLQTLSEERLAGIDERSHTGRAIASRIYESFGREVAILLSRSSARPTRERVSPEVLAAVDEEFIAPASLPVSRPEPRGAMTKDQEIDFWHRQFESAADACEADRREIESLRSQLAEREQELQEAREVVALVNNEVVGSYGYFVNPGDPSGTPLCIRNVRRLKEQATREYQRAERAESTLSALRALLAPIGELEQRATPGPWHVHRPRKAIYLRNFDGVYVLEQTQYGVRTDADAELIAACRNVLPELFEALKETP